MSRINCFPTSRRRPPATAFALIMSVTLPLTAALIISLALTAATAQPVAAQTQVAQTSALAADDGNETCISCHAEEGTAWERSAHGSVPPESLSVVGGASCVDCHGPYLKGHPATGTVRLSVDSSQCQECHVETYDQWEHTQHAGEGVQCISCHTPHSQGLRLTDEALCSSCHRDNLDDPLHAAHFTGDVNCTNCHMNGVAYTGPLAATDVQVATLSVPTHDFVTVNAQNCLTCHRDDVDTPVATQSTTSQVAASTVAAQDKTSFVDDVLSIANLGFGVGIGGVLGIVFMLFAATALQRKDS